MLTITPDQVILIGFIAAGIAQAIKLIAAASGKTIGRKWVTGILFALSIGIAVLWSSSILPPFPDFATIPPDPSIQVGAVIVWLGQIIAVSASVIGFATAIYNLLLQKVFDALGWTSDAVAKAKLK